MKWPNKIKTFFAYLINEEPEPEVIQPQDPAPVPLPEDICHGKTMYVIPSKWDHGNGSLVYTREKLDKWLSDNSSTEDGVSSYKVLVVKVVGTYRPYLIQEPKFELKDAGSN